MRGRRVHRREAARTCVACRRRAAPEDLVRLAAAGDRIVVSRTAAGRGAWLCPSASCLERARRSGVVARALRRAGASGLPSLGELTGAGNDAGRGVRG